MAWPPVIPPATRANATPQLDNHPGDHNAISQALTDVVNQLDVTAWTALPLGAGWTNLGTTLAKAAYRRALGIVQLQGVLTFTGTPAGGSTVFTLPAGFRPTATQRCFVLVNNGFAIVDVTNAGVGTWQGMAGTGVTAGMLALNTCFVPLVALP